MAREEAAWEFDASLFAVALAARLGDESAFAVLYGRMKGMVFALALRLTRNRTDAEDICQDVFLKFRFEWNPDRSLDDRSVQSWFATTTRYQAIDRLRGLGRELRRVEHYADLLRHRDGSHLLTTQLGAEQLHPARRAVADYLTRLNGTPRNHQDRCILCLRWGGADSWLWAESAAPADDYFNRKFDGQPDWFDDFLLARNARAPGEVARLAGVPGYQVTKVCKRHWHAMWRAVYRACGLDPNGPEVPGLGGTP